MGTARLVKLIAEERQETCNRSEPRVVARLEMGAGAALARGT
jgi:hypothetical protein